MNIKEKTMSEITHEIDSNFAGRLNILRAGVLRPMTGSFPSLELLSALPVQPVIFG